MCWLEFFLTLHLGALVRHAEKKNMWHPPVESFSASAKNLLKSHKVERQKASGSFGEGRVVPLHGQDPPWSQPCVSHA